MPAALPARAGPVASGHPSHLRLRWGAHRVADELAPSIERNFVFDPTKGIDPADLAALDRTIVDRKSQIERTLQSGPAELEKIRYETRVRRRALLQQIETAARTVAQAEADYKAL